MQRFHCPLSPEFSTSADQNRRYGYVPVDLPLEDIPIKDSTNDDFCMLDVSCGQDATCRIFLVPGYGVAEKFDASFSTDVKYRRNRTGNGMYAGLG